MNATSSAPKRFRWLRILGILLALLLILGVIAFQVAIRQIKGGIVAALGPQAEIRELNVGFSGVEIVGLRLPAGQIPGWPAENLLQVKRIAIEPSLRDLLSANIVARSIRIEGAYVSLFRTREGDLKTPFSLVQAKSHTDTKIAGMYPVKYLPLPLAGNIHRSGVPALAGFALVPGGALAASPNQQAFRVERIELVDSVVEFFDAAARPTLQTIRVENLDVQLDHLQFPGLKGQTRVRADGVVKGQRQNGTLHLAGWVAPGSKESDLQMQLTGVDFTTLQAYLIRPSERGMNRCAMDLSLRAQIRQGQLHAPGTLSLARLELADQGRTFMGVPRNMVNILLQSGKDRIDLEFTLEGNLNDPNFSVSDSIMKTLGAAFAKALMANLGSLLQGSGGSNDEAVAKDLLR
jgi:hypothetical protein